MLAPWQKLAWLALVSALALLPACSSVPVVPQVAGSNPQRVEQGNEVVMLAITLMDRGYKFGGDHPDSGLDCSGMVSYIYQQAVGIKLPHNAAQMAREGKTIPMSALSPGDLVFFNTTGQSFSHVGIYIGDDRFIHAPKQDGRIKISSLKNAYFEKRLEAARTYLHQE